MIEISNINFKALHKLSLEKNGVSFATESDIYHDNVNAYKIYKKLKPCDLINKKKKINLLLDIGDIPNVIMPKDYILNKKANKHYNYSGYIMDYVDSYSLYDYFDNNDDLELLLQILYNVSLTLRDIHSKDIVVTDLNFDNIVIKKDDNAHRFIDFDGCSIDGILGENMSNLLYDFLYQYRICHMDVNYNRDRLSLILEVFRLLFNNSLQDNSKYEIESKMEKFDDLGDLTKILLDLTDKDKPIRELPYLDEVIKINKRTF